MQIIVEIAKDVQEWNDHKYINKTLIKKILRNVLMRFKCFEPVKNFELSILLTNDDRMQALNGEFRNKQKPTNVLSFPDIELNRQGLLEFKPDLNYMYLGDIAFGYQTIKSEAIALEKSFKDRFTHLLVHSILHLIGFDHQNEKDANEMESLEIEILKDFAITNLY